MINLTHRKRLAATIRDALASETQRDPRDITALDRAVDQWKKDNPKSEDVLLDRAYHQFLHFLIDRDIRIKDQEYSNDQISLMQRLITELENERV